MFLKKENEKKSDNLVCVLIFFLSSVPLSLFFFTALVQLVASSRFLSCVVDSMTEDALRQTLASVANPLHKRPQ